MLVPTIEMVQMSLSGSVTAGKMYDNVYPTIILFVVIEVAKEGTALAPTERVI